LIAARLSEVEMDFEYTPEQEAFRSQVREWLINNLPPDLCIDDPMDERIAPNREVFERRRAWQRKLAEGGWVGLSWPRQYGGRQASLLEQIIFDEEYFRARAPILPGYSGVGLLGPTLMQWGSEEQKRKYLPRILPGDDIWCQGYSEPGAGSDLASLQTRAELKGDYFVVNGQKVWTSGAQFADRMFLLARTDPNAPKHKGISYLLLDDMRSPGVDVRPLVVMNGHHHFNEVFFDNLRIPRENLVGPMNEGWKVAVTTLAFERGIAGGGGHSSQVRRLAELARSFKIDSPCGLGLRMGSAGTRAVHD
jgi:alkylation response protein AidB-like acyl-CoA dehydrogenase